MIRLDIQPYCSECFDFEPDVKRPEKIRIDDPEEKQPIYIPSDTVVRCRWAKRCESIKRFLDAQIKKESAE